MANIYRCVSWSAVSTEKQAEEISLDIQKQTNAINAAAMKGSIVAELTVPGHSREYDTIAEIAEDVPAYAELLNMIQKKSFDVLLAYRPDRLARTPSLLLEIAHKCWRHDVAIYIDSMPPQTLDPRRQRADMSQKLLLAFGGVQAGDDLEVLRERHRTGMAHRVKVKGLDPGKLRYGYKYEYLSNQRSKVVDDVAAKTIRFVLLDLYVGRQLGQRAILRILNDRGMVTPSRRREQVWGEAMPNASDTWYPGSIYEIIRCARHYAGYLEYNRRTTRSGEDTRRQHTGWVKADFPAILTEEEIAAVEVEQERRSVGPRRTYPLSGICICAVCKQPMTGNLQRDRYWAKTGKHYRYMRCRKCRVFVREDDIADTLRDLFTYIRDNANVEHLFAHSDNSQEDSLVAQIAQATEQAADAIAAMDRLIDALADGTLPAERIHERLRQKKAESIRLEIELTELRQELNELRQKPTPVETTEEIRQDGIAVVDGMIDNPVTAQQWFRRHIAYVEVSTDSQCKVVFH